MPVIFIGNRLATSHKTALTTVPFTLSSAGAVGNILVAGIISDPVAVGDNVYPLVSGFGVDDARWKQLNRYTQGSGTSGVLVSIWAGVITTSGVTSGSLVYSTTVATAKALIVGEFAGATSPYEGTTDLNAVRDVYATQGGGTATSTSVGLSATSRAWGDLHLSCAGAEATFVAGNWASGFSSLEGGAQVGEAGTAAGGSASNVGGAFAYAVGGTNQSPVGSPNSGLSSVSGNLAQCTASIRQADEGWLP